jgi:hypothetical protein
MRLKETDAIFIDTSIVDGDYRLRSGGLLHLIRVCRMANLNIILPAVVLSDLVAHYRDDVERLMGQSQRLQDECDRYFYSGGSVKIDFDGSSLVSSYRDWLYKRVKSLGISVGDYPLSSHNEIVERACARKKPFKEHDRGYKDTLMWLGILEYVKKRSGNVYLLSLDKDFGESALHQDLVDDLYACGIDEQRVMLFRDFESMLVRLYDKYDIRTTLEEEERASWASISKKELKRLVPFEHAILSRRLAIEKEILINPQLYTPSPQIERLVSLSERMDLKDLDFVPSYTGSGIWKLDGRASIRASAEYGIIVDRETRSLSRYEDIDLEVVFTLYYSCSQDVVTDTIINKVFRKSA